MRRDREVTLEEIEECMITSALLVDKYGDEMLPILERFEREYVVRKQKRDAPSHTDRIKALLAKDHKEPPLPE